MGSAETLIAVIQQLRGIFLEKSELKGYDDWDRFFGCINAIQRVAQSLAEEADVSEPEETAEVMEVGR